MGKAEGPFYCDQGGCEKPGPFLHRQALGQHSAKAHGIGTFYGCSVVGCSFPTSCYKNSAVRHYKEHLALGDEVRPPPKSYRGPGEQEVSSIAVKPVSIRKPTYHAKTDDFQWFSEPPVLPTNTLSDARRRKPQASVPVIRKLFGSSSAASQQQISSNIREANHLPPLIDLHTNNKGNKIADGIE